MAKRFHRKDVMERLQEEIQAGNPLLMFGAGTGLTARCAELGGADLIAVYSTAHYRMIAQPSLLAWLPYENANDLVVRMAREILPVVKETPCIAGIGAHDPRLDMDAFIDQLLEMGFSGCTNEPFVGIYGEKFAAQLEAAGLGFSKEVELIKTCHERDVFTVAWAFTPDEGRAMARAGADVIGAIVGVTAGGLTGTTKAQTLEEAAQQIEDIYQAAKEVNPEIIILTHGGPLKDVETAEYSLIHTSAAGYASGSSGERIPTETAVTEITRQYKKCRIK
ncbi:MAG TPA: phosphoenolpyruvate hydrolase family protein [Syntrophomonadaceae bacterium]|nr:phosphoenolpyruvate hydrolase family protein [Syntrophomonadaceae bacterium]